MVGMIVVFLCVVLFVKYISHRFSRIYVLAEEIGGPKGCPLLGYVPLFLKKEFLEAMVDVDKQFFGIARFWFGHKLIVSLNDPSLYGELLTNKSALDKGDFYHFMEPLFGVGLIASDSHAWQINRKIVAPMLNVLKIKSHVKVFSDGSKILVEHWQNKLGTRFEPYADVSRATFNFIMRTAAGIDTEWSTSQTDWLVNLINRISSGIAYRFLRPWLYPDFIFSLTSKGSQVKADTAAFREFLREMIASEKLTNDNAGFLSHILNVSRTNPDFPESAVLDELSTYITAGFETTSTAITFTLVMLGCHSQLQERVYEEQVNIAVEGKKVNWDDLNRMVYLECFIKETMRLFPVITIIGRQLQSDISIDKYVIPEGTFAMIPIFAVHRKPEIWKDPLEFEPNRFVSEEEKTRNPFAFLPFGGGSRICMGQKYAMVSMKVMLSEIIRNFKIMTDYKMEDIKLSKSVTLNTTGLSIILERRDTRNE